jgi:hypothetical protein
MGGLKRQAAAATPLRFYAFRSVAAAFKNRRNRKIELKEARFLS